MPFPLRGNCAFWICSEVGGDERFLPSEVPCKTWFEMSRWEKECLFKQKKTHEDQNILKDVVEELLCKQSDSCPLDKEHLKNILYRSFYAHTWALPLNRTRRCDDVALRSENTERNVQLFIKIILTICRLVTRNLSNCSHSDDR